jgi:hypothetical protein
MKGEKMEKAITKITLLVMIVVVSMLMVAQIAKAEIKNSKHDLSSNSTGGIKSQINDICVFCHTPHNSNLDSTAPLWNRSVKSTGYTQYTGTMKASPSQPKGVSAACLSCHDGTVALDTLKNTIAPQTFSFDNAKTSATNKNLAGAVGLLGTDLSNDHPISIAYGATGATGLRTVTVATGLGIKLYGASGSETVECASCHDVHEPGTTSAGTAPFLRTSNLGSLLCLACHSK